MTFRSLFLVVPVSNAVLRRLRQWEDAIQGPALTVLLAIQLAFIFLASPLVSIKLLPPLTLDWLQVLMTAVSFVALRRHSPVRVLIVVCLLPMAWTMARGSNVYVGLLLHMLVTLAITIAVAHAVFGARTVTRHQLLGALVVYLNLALLFMGIFAGTRFAFPEAFVSMTKLPLQRGELLYFSLTTLTSTGYGDILPVHPLARSMANLESVLGQVFLATFLARLVSLHSSARP